jgi:hypothetical protein
MGHGHWLLGQVTGMSIGGHGIGHGHATAGSQTVSQNFWRTLVADRGLGGTYPPIRYARLANSAFGESVAPDIDISKLIVHCGSASERQFLQRVQSTI